MILKQTSSDKLYKRAKELFPGGVHSPVRSFVDFKRAPLFFKKGQGAFLESVEGQNFIDYCQSFGPNILGHRNPEVQEEVALALKDLWTSGAADPYSLEFSEWLCEKLPWLEMLRFVNSGTEAVMSALRLARGITGREKVIKFEGCYHGHLDSLLVKAGSGLAVGSVATSSAGISQQLAETTLIAQLNDEKDFEQIMEEHGNTVAAVIIEPLPANFGLLPQRESFLKFVQEKTHKNQSLFILDEVISGFRIGFGGMTERWNLKPDLITYGKVLGGGFPLACYGGLKKHMEHIAPCGPVYQAGTLSANPIAVRAGFATLKQCQKSNFYKTLNSLTHYLCHELNELLKHYNYPASVIQEESLFWIHASPSFQSPQPPQPPQPPQSTQSPQPPQSTQPFRNPMDIPKTQKKIFEPLFLHLLKEGVYLSPQAYEVGFVSYAHSKEVINKTLTAFDKALKTLSTFRKESHENSFI